MEGGLWGRDGRIEEAPGARVRPDQTVAVAPDASLLELTPVTLLLHKPTGFEAGLGLPSAPTGPSPATPWENIRVNTRSPALPVRRWGVAWAPRRMPIARVEPPLTRPATR